MKRIAGIVAALFLSASQLLAVAPAPAGAPERWDFAFDSREWVLVDQQTTEVAVIRNYVPRGQTLGDWTEMVTSVSFRLRADPSEVSHALLSGAAKDCPSFHQKVLEESSESILVAWADEGCGGHRAQDVLQRIAVAPDGTLALSYTQRTSKADSERQARWVAILRAAKIKSAEMAPKPSSSPSLLPAESEYLKTVGGGMSLVKAERASLGLSLEVRKALPPAAVVVAEFENPQAGASPITVVVDRAGKEKPNPRAQQSFADSFRETLAVSSPDLQCVTNHKIYRVVVTIYGDASRQTRLATHEQGVEFSIPDEILSQMAIPECGK